jgi:hypothetical protein
MYFTHMPATTPVVVSVMPCALPSMYISHMAAAIAEGSCLLRAVWLQCDHRVLTATHEFWCNQRRLLQGVQAQALHGISACDSPHTCCTLCCCKLVLAVAWVQGSRSTAAHTECGAILIQQYQGVQAHCACSMWVQGSCCSPRKATASAAEACAHLFVTATEF